MIYKKKFFRKEIIMDNIRKDCYHCLHLRPRKNNLCSELRKNVPDIHKYTCKNFRVDNWLVENEKKIESKDDDSSSLILHFQLNLKHLLY